ncbi:MAG: hypothetical protein ACRC9X_03395 [Bacteroidales bacterium]
MKIKIASVAFFSILLTACNFAPISTMNQQIPKILDALRELYPNLDECRAQKGIQQVAELWRTTDGRQAEFVQFCTVNYVHNENDRRAMFDKFSDKMEIILGNFNVMMRNLQKPLHEVGAPITEMDLSVGALNLSAHLVEDFFSSKIAFKIILNFPSYSLTEKNKLGRDWDNEQWAYARLGEAFASRVPAHITQDIAAANTATEDYIANYNIAMGVLRNVNNEALFPKEMRLISHWGLRDELKSNYADKQQGLERQRMIYTVMKRIVLQEIPEKVINSECYTWNPISNIVAENGKIVKFAPERNTRYEEFLKSIKTLLAQDKYEPKYPSHIQRTFDGGIELSLDEVRKMFTQLVSSNEIKQIATLIKQRLGRNLEPFDIWYDGFKVRSTISQDILTEQTEKKYPDAETFERDMPQILYNLGFSSYDAHRVSQRIAVDAARGSGHAWGAQMKGDRAHLRTRIPAKGMDYKGYNIALHELGHNVEQTISLYDVAYYMMNGVPNTAFTEALAFIFQKRDLQLLGYTSQSEEQQSLSILDVVWGTYEIMGVALVDMAVWEWIYANPNITAQQLKENVIRIAQETWNTYYAPLLGETNSPILAIYSHMINSPLYLPNYPLGHLIELQLEEYLQGRDFADEILRIFSLGRLTPQQWMLQAVGKPLSVEATLIAASKAIKSLTESEE